MSQLVNWFSGTPPEFPDMTISSKGEGRAVTRVTSDDGIEVKLRLCITRKQFERFGLCDSRV